MNTLGKVFAVAVAMLVAGQASALSCVRPDVAWAFARASEAEKTYVVLYGQLSFQEPALREGVEQQIEANFQGQGLGIDGFGAVDPLSVDLVFACAGPWCGRIASGETVMAFVERDGNRYTMTVDPCYSSVFTNPGAGDLARAEACMRGEACTPDHLR